MAAATPAADACLHAGHFLSSCSRLLRASIRPSGCELRGRFTNCVVAPIGIDPEYFQG